jgi:curved DNA-binding protein CbpA
VNDYFALLNQPRRPWLDPEAVRAAFLALSTGIHPDRVHNASPETRAAAQERFAALNAACNCLRDPKERLRHLLHLERGVKPAQLERAPAQRTDFYFELAGVCGETDKFLRAQAPSPAPLLKARSFARALALREELEKFQAELACWRGELEREVQALNAAWEEAPENGSARFAALPLDRLEQLYRDLSYVLRWSEQIRERVIRLSL